MPPRRSSLVRRHLPATASPDVKLNESTLLTSYQSTATLFIMATSSPNPFTGHYDENRTAFIALGSNLPSIAGDPAATVRAASHRLSGLAALVASSSLYATDPVGEVPQPPFVNAVVALHTSLGPEALLQRLMSIEREFGRDRKGPDAAPKGPRTLDLDILMMNDLVMNTPELRVPHPGMAVRRFVLAPLAEIAPGLVHPLLNKTVAALLADLPDGGQNSIEAVRVLAPGIMPPSLMGGGRR
ncbi:MAG TPA: 2-amino-4-hydroxy-6-hydroxymethyldihydropteridine diphosphokinase [Acidisarcina sp.]